MLWAGSGQHAMAVLVCHCQVIRMFFNLECQIADTHGKSPPCSWFAKEEAKHASKRDCCKVKHFQEMKSCLFSRLPREPNQKKAATSVIKPPRFYPASSRLSLPKRFGTRSVCRSLSEDARCSSHINRCSFFAFEHLELSEAIDCSLTG